MVFLVFPWVPVVSFGPCGFLWFPMVSVGVPVVSLGSCGFLWFPMVFLCFPLDSDGPTTSQAGPDANFFLHPGGLAPRQAVGSGWYMDSIWIVYG